MQNSNNMQFFYTLFMRDNNFTLKVAVQSLEKEIIKKCGSVNKAASKLGLSQPALWEKCKVLDIDINKN